MSKKNYIKGFSGKGYYIALILCAVAIGISGYLYYRNANDDVSLQKEPVSTVGADSQDGVEAVATQSGDIPGTDNATEPTKAKLPGKITKPVNGEMIAQYAMEALSYNQTTRDWRVHSGVDYAAEAGTAVVAAADGKVYTVYEDETMGTTVVISHEGGYTTQYSSLSEKLEVAAGDTVTSGQTIGYVGNTALLENAIGDHLHFSVSCNDQYVDPEEFLN